jgi:Ca2+-binding RTX toxin-like protein
MDIDFFGPDSNCFYNAIVGPNGNLSVSGIPTSTQIVFYEADNDRTTIVTGTGFTFDAFGNPTGGTVTGVEFHDGSATGPMLATVSNIAWALTDVKTAIDEALLGNTTPLGNLIYSTPTVFDASASATGFIMSSGLFPINWTMDIMATGSDSGDYFIGGLGNDTILGGLGNDSVFGGDGRDTLKGGGNNDLILGNNGADWIEGNNGRDTLVGENGNDTIKGGNGADVISGGSGSDALKGNAGGDIIVGDDGNDRLFGGSGNDSILGGAGNDKIYGEKDDDMLGGDAGDDQIRGGSGNDSILGGDGDDTLWGNNGSDVFVFENGWGNDVIKDFKANNAEDIDLSGVGAITSFADLIANHLVNVGGEAMIVANANSILLQGVAFADVGVGLDYSAADFIF